MAKIRYAVGVRYKLDGQTYVIKQLLPHHKLVVEDESTGTQSTVHRMVLKVPGASAIKQDLPLNRPRTTRPLERVEIDHVMLDVMVVDDEHRLQLGRPTLTCAIDDYTGMPLGLSVSFEPPGHEGDASCLSHTILPKDDVQEKYGTKNPWPAYGVPELLVLDSGKEFNASGLMDACRQLGINVTRLPLRSTQLKASLERAFRAMNVGLLHELPRIAPSDQPLESDEGLEEQDESPPQHQYPLITMSGFMAAIHVFLIDIYAQSWNAARGCVPAKCWQDSIEAGYVPMLPANTEEVRMLFWPTATRTLQRNGIEFERLRYKSPELAQLGSRLGTDKRVSIKYDPSDLGRIYVSVASVDSEGGDGGWLAVPALHQDYAAGMTLWQHRALLGHARAAKDDVDIYSLSEAKLNLGQLIRDESAPAGRRAFLRRKLARFLDNEPANLRPVDVSKSAPLPQGSVEPQPISPEPQATDEAGTTQG